MLDHGLRQLAESLHPGAGIGEGGDELQVAVVGSTQGLAQGGQAVEALLHVRPLGDAGSIALFYLAVVRKKGDIVDRGLDAQDETELVVHLQAHRPQGVFDPCPLNTEVEAVPQFVLIIPVQLLAQERGHMLGFDGMDGGARQVLIEGLQVRLAAEDDIGRLLGLIQAPVV